VTNGSLTPLEAGLLTTKLHRDCVRQQIDAVRRKIGELEGLIAQCEEHLEAAEIGYDQMHRHAGNAFRARNRKKARRKVDRRYKYGLKARQARDDLRRYKRRLHIQCQRLESLNEAASRARTQFVMARHYYMKSLSRQVLADEVACARLAHYAELAKVPLCYAETLAQVWYYAETDRAGEVLAVHLFYGGRRAPTGDGRTPDGSGHAHRVLTRTPSGLTLVYKREVAPPAHKKGQRREVVMAATA
jgi:hypothetical protein